MTNPRTNALVGLAAASALALTGRGTAPAAAPVSNPLPAKSRHLFLL